MHLYTLDVAAEGAKAKQLTSGKWEVSGSDLSRDGTRFYVTTSEVHPGERHVYTVPADGGKRTRLTTRAGSNEPTLSPDESTLALVHSYSNKPPEVYLMPNRAGAEPRQVTTTPTEEWRAFNWIDPKVITYKASDGVDVHARLYTPEMIGARRDPSRPGVVFVHGAGYLQNAHRYWSTYFREYMFHNLLASRGYVVLDVDYRASAGYGRDWRTAIYRHMGGKDLEDIVDGAKYLAAKEQVDPRRIGVYGGSYGGFITLMAMFTTPDAFAAGAALRPVTDWARYNHGYTSNILNVPQRDAEAYRKSSPIYFADGPQRRAADLSRHGGHQRAFPGLGAPRAAADRAAQGELGAGGLSGREPRVHRGHQLGRRIPAHPEAVRGEAACAEVSRGSTDSQSASGISGRRSSGQSGLEADSRDLAARCLEPAEQRPREPRAREPASPRVIYSRRIWHWIPTRFWTCSGVPARCSKGISS